MSAEGFSKYHSLIVEGKEIALIGIMIGICSVASLSYAEPKYRGTSEALYPSGTSVRQVFDNVSTIDTAVSIDPHFLPDQGTMQIVVNGSPTAYDIVVEGSLIGPDGPFVPLLSLTELDLTMGHFALKSVPFAQVRLEAITGDGSFDVYTIHRGN